MPIFVVATETDHIAPWNSVYKLHLFTDGELHFVLTNGGHNAGIVSEPGHPGRYFHFATRPPGDRYVDSATWLSRAHRADGIVVGALDAVARRAQRPATRQAAGHGRGRARAAAARGGAGQLRVSALTNFARCRTGRTRPTRLQPCCRPTWRWPARPPARAKAGRDCADALSSSACSPAPSSRFGAIFMTVVLTGAGDLPWGVARLLGGLVVFARAHPGDRRRRRTVHRRCADDRRLRRPAHLVGARCCAPGRLVYVGNIAGAVGTAALVFFAGHYGFADGAVGKTALADRLGQGRAADRSAVLSRRALQRAGMPRGVDVVWRAQRHRQGDGHRAADRRLRRRRLRALDRQSLFSALRAGDQSLGRAASSGRRSGRRRRPIRR